VSTFSKHRDAPGPGAQRTFALVAGASQFAALAAQLYLIAFTGYADADIRDSCLDAGFDVHLVKPGDINLLEKLLGSDRAGA